MTRTFAEAVQGVISHGDKAARDDLRRLHGKVPSKLQCVLRHACSAQLGKNLLEQSAAALNVGVCRGDAVTQRLECRAGVQVNQSGEQAARVACLAFAHLGSMALPLVEYTNDRRPTT